MQITRSGSIPSSKGPADWFTGTVRIDPLMTPAPPARAFGEKHGHGAGPTTAMMHIAVQESLDGEAVNCMHHASDAEYPVSASGS